jgi:hypothetical protein
MSKIKTHIDIINLGWFLLEFGIFNSIMRVLDQSDRYIIYDEQVRSKSLYFDAINFADILMRLILPTTTVFAKIQCDSSL